MTRFGRLFCVLGLAAMLEVAGVARTAAADAPPPGAAFPTPLDAYAPAEGQPLVSVLSGRARHDSFTPELKYAVVADAVTGGGRTVIANAPNPAGPSILQRFFEGGIAPLRLALGAITPTIIMGVAYVALPF